MTARAAKGSFPYPHRTVAEVDDAETSMIGWGRGPGALDRFIGLGFDHGASGLQVRSRLPDVPCGRCGARGMCDHRRVAA
jgi:hypothetical protein